MGKVRHNANRNSVRNACLINKATLSNSPEQKMKAY